MAKTKDLGAALAASSTRHRKRRKAAVDVVNVANVPRLVELGRVRTDGDTQPRVAMDPDTIELYKERMALDERTQFIQDPEGQQFEPIVVFEDGDDYWLADGFHRVEAARQLGLAAIQAFIHRGAQREAFLHSLGVNAIHGKRRTRADKRRTVERALEDAQLLSSSDAVIAKLCKVTDRYVSKLRQELEASGAIEFQERLLGADGRWHDVLRDPVTPTSAHVRRAPAPARKPAKQSKTFAAATLSDFAQLSELASAARVLITYPVSLADFEYIALHAASVVERGRLVVALPQGSPLGLTGPATLAGLLDRGFDGPHFAHIKDHKRTYLVLSKGARELGAITTSTELVKIAGAQVTVCGAALDSW